GVVARDPQLGLGKRLVGGAAEDAVAAGNQLVGARQTEVVLRRRVDHPPRAEVRGTAGPRGFFLDGRPRVPPRATARLVLLIIELLDDIIVGAVDVKIEAVVEVVDVRRGKDLALADEGAERRRVAGAGVLEWSGQADLGHQAAVVAEAPAVDVVIAPQV